MIEGFHVIRVLSEGAAAELLLARAEETNETVVVEVLRPELLGDAAVLKRFRSAMAQRQQVQHPGLVRRVSEGATPDGRPYLVSEAVGESLATWVAARGNLPFASVLQVLEGVCGGLAHLHEQGVAHGNVKPSTVYVEPTPDGLRARLFDCGLMLLRPGRSLKVPPSRILVEAEYLSPERIRGRRATPSSDVYAVGVLFYELLSGFPPFCGSDSNVVRRQHLEASSPPLPEHLADAQRVIARCLEKEPAARYRSVGELRAALDELAHQVRSPDAEFEIVDQAASEVIGSYELVEPLGEGAIGRVFRARHVTLLRDAALKVMKPEHLRYPEVVARFVQEAQAVSRIKHEHIVEVFDVVIEPGEAGRARRAYIVMELLAGQSFSALLKEGPLPLSRIVRIARQIASALDAAHRHGIVHRDVKPDNIFICDRQGDFAKVLDFGVAKLRGVRDDDGLAVGTPMFMAPEQVRDEDVDHRADIYAMGVVLFRALSGRFPTGRAVNAVDLFNRILNQPPEPTPEATAGGEPVPAPLRALVDRCLEKSVERRPQSMSEVATVLEGLLVEKRASAPSPAARRRRWVSALAAAALAAAALAAPLLGAYAVNRQEPGEALPAPAPALARVTVVSVPPGATVTRSDDGQVVGVTPAELLLPRGQHLTLTVALDGYQPQSADVRAESDQVLQLALAPLATRPDAPATKKKKPPKRKRILLRDDVLDPF